MILAGSSALSRGLVWAKFPPAGWMTCPAVEEELTGCWSPEEEALAAARGAASTALPMWAAEEAEGQTGPRTAPSLLLALPLAFWLFMQRAGNIPPLFFQPVSGKCF